jgi:hypothetical protein
MTSSASPNWRLRWLSYASNLPAKVLHCQPMPESRKRKRPQKRPNRAVPNKRTILPKVTDLSEEPDAERRTRSPHKPLAEELLYQPVELPEPASYDQVLVALSELDPLAQEVLIASRLAAMPSPSDPENGMPVHIERVCRGPWAHGLRKLGIFCIPELATHELVAPDRATGAMVNHTASTMRKLDRDDIWKMTQQQHPEVAKLVENAKTPEEKAAAMAELTKKLPAHIRIAMQRLASHTDEELALT